VKLVRVHLRDLVGPKILKSEPLEFVDMLFKRLQPYLSKCISSRYPLIRFSVMAVYARSNFRVQRENLGKRRVFCLITHTIQEPVHEGIMVSTNFISFASTMPMFPVEVNNPSLP
jgi:hypothetical protein